MPASIIIVASKNAPSKISIFSFSKGDTFPDVSFLKRGIATEPAKNKATVKYIACSSPEPKVVNVCACVKEKGRG